MGSVPSARSIASNNAAPGPGTHSPWIAVASRTGMRQQAAKPRKWSMRSRSKDSSAWRMRATHHE
jgi:hypothetical protein